MEKKYMTPSVEVNEISATEMICESLDVVGEANGTEVGFQKATRERGSYEPVEEDNTDFGSLW